MVNEFKDKKDADGNIWGNAVLLKGLEWKMETSGSTSDALLVSFSGSAYWLSYV
jgi:hypothetical protein